MLFEFVVLREGEGSLLLNVGFTIYISAKNSSTAFSQFFPLHLVRFLSKGKKIDEGQKPNIKT